MSSKKIHFFALCGFLCSSCLTPPVAEKRPEYALNGTWKHDLSPNCKSSLSSDNWWEIFQDPILTELIQKGLDKSPSIEKALARFEEASWFTKITGSEQYPQLSFTSTADRRRIPSSLRTKTSKPSGKTTTPEVPATTVVVPPPPPLTIPVSPTSITVPPVVVPTTSEMKTVRSPRFVNDLIANLFISYELDFWGKYYLKTQAAKARAEAAQDDLKTARLLLADQIAATYFTLQALDKELTCLREEIAIHTKRVSLLAEQVDKGLSNEFQLLQERATLEIKISDEQAFLKTRENNTTLLAVLIGEQPHNADINISSAPWIFPIVPAGVPSSLLAKRPDVMSAMKEVDAVIAEIGAAKTELLPSLTLSGTAGHEATKANKWFKWKNHIWSIGASLAQPIFDADRRMSEVESTKARFRQAAATLTDTVLSSIKEVEDALILIKTQEERKASAIKREKAFSTVAALRNDLFTTGAQDFIIVLQTQEDLLQATRDRINEEYNLQLGALSLMKSLGGSWECIHILEPVQNLLRHSS